MDRIRNFLGTSGGRYLAVALFVAAMAFFAFFAHRALTSAVVSENNTRMFIDSTNLKPFSHALRMGETLPVVSPYTGRRTGYPAERCYWTKGGRIKRHPTYVLLNNLIGKPGPTFCPVCGRLVVPHNPKPRPGATPPPTKAQYEAMLKKYQRATRAPP